METLLCNQSKNDYGTRSDVYKQSGVMERSVTGSVSSDQAVPDHQVTAAKSNQSQAVKSKKIGRVATWNVRTFHQAGKLVNVRKVMMRMKISALGMSEVR